MVIAFFSVEDKERRSCFFGEIFLLADISMDIVLRMPFFILNNVEINFIDLQIHLKLYIVTKVHPTTRGVEWIEKKKFVAIALDLEDKIFIVHVASIYLDSDVNSSQKAQTALLEVVNAPTIIPFEYADFVDIFSKDLPAKLPEYTDINDYIINLIKG